MRLNIVRNSIIIFIILITGYLFYLQVIRGGHFARLSLNNSIRVVPFEGARGRIFDRNGKLLADNRKSYHAVVVPQDIRNKKELFAFISSIIDVDPAIIEKRYFKNKTTPFAPVTLAEDLSRSQAIRIEEDAFRFPGLIILQKFSRQYPFAENCAHIVGYVGKVDPFKEKKITEYGFSAEEFVGYSGIEEYYDDVLRGGPGGRQIEVNSRGQQTQLLSVREPTDGNDLVLTIDEEIQDAARLALAGRAGAVVVLDPVNGEVLALVSSPSYNSNAFVDRDKRDLLQGYFNSTGSPLLNRAVSGAFPPGSVFKIPVAMGGLEENKIKLSTIFDCPGYFGLGDRTYRFPHAWGNQDLTSAMAHSANEYFFHIGLMLGRQSMVKYARAFGLGERTGIDLPYESRGSLPESKISVWYKGDTVNMSIGQGGLLTTPVQLARLIAAVENKGIMPTPHILMSGINNFPKPDSVHLSFRKDAWLAVRQGLTAVVASVTGTAHLLADIPGVETYGKTGTAQAGAKKQDHAWFAGVSRTDQRIIAYCVFLEHGGSSTNAVLLTKEFITALREQGKI